MCRDGYFYFIVFLNCYFLIVILGCENIQLAPVVIMIFDK